MAYIPQTSHVTLLATIRRRRALPAPGELVVSEGQRVSAGDLIGTCEIAESHQLLDVAGKLGVKVAKLEPYLLKREGDLVKKGENIARRKGLFGLSRTATAGADSRLVLYEEGKALLARVRAVEVRAGLSGRVVGLGETSVNIETTGALLSGVWGNGQDAVSVLRLATGEPNQVLHAGLLEPSLRGAIIAAGNLSDPSLFAGLVEVGAAGLIAGKLSARLLDAARAATLPVMVVEGFGEGGFSLPVFQFLSGNSGREMWLNACVWDAFGGDRPEAIIPLPSPGSAPAQALDGQPLEEGKRVRILRGPEAGRIGRVTGLSDRAMPLPSGLRTRLAVIALEDAHGHQPTVSAPLANVELVE
jgi:hypothetical protein